MTHLEYQEEIKNNYSNYQVEIAPISLTLDLSYKVGQLSDVINTVLKDQSEESINEKVINNITINIGDIYKILNELASSLNISFNDIVSLNIRKQQLLKEKRIKEKKSLQNA